MNKDLWSKPYMGITHRRVGKIQATINDFGSGSVYGYILNLNSNTPFTSVFEKWFKSVELAKKKLNRKLSQL